MTPLTLQQVEALQHSPRKTVRQLVLTAAAAMRRADELATQLRQKEEELAAAQLDKDQRILVVLHRNGTVDLWARHKQPVHIACLHDLGRGREDEAEDDMLRRLPVPYKELFTKHGSVLASGTCRGCMDRNTYEYMHVVQGSLQVVEKMKEAASA